MALIATSIVAADWANLGEALEIVRDAGASMVHVDVMDGHFVPEISVGVPVVASLRKFTDLPIEVHLLIERPERLTEDFLKAGADRICLHLEAARDLPRALDSIRAKNAKAGVALLYSTPLDSAREILEEIDFLTILCGVPKVENHGTDFVARSVGKIREAARLRSERGLSFLIEVEGGIDGENSGKVLSAGADILVTGPDIFNTGDPRGQLTRIVQATHGSRGVSRV